MTWRSKVLPASVKTSTRSVSTTGPLAAMLMTRNSMRSMPGGPGRMNEAMLSAMFSLPVTGSNGMLWYTASSVKNAARSSAPRSLGFSICFPPGFVFGAVLPAGLALGEGLFQGEPNAGTVLHDRRVDLVALGHTESNPWLMVDEDQHRVVDRDFVAVVSYALLLLSARCRPRSRPLRSACRSCREQQLLAHPFFFEEAVGLGGFRHR